MPQGLVSVGNHFNDGVMKNKNDFDPNHSSPPQKR